MPALDKLAWFGQVLSHHKLSRTMDYALSLALGKDLTSWESRDVLMSAFHGLWGHWAGRNLSGRKGLALMPVALQLPGEHLGLQ